MFVWREKERKTRRKEKEKKIVYKGRKEKGRKEKQRKEKERKENSTFPSSSSDQPWPIFPPSPVFIFVAFFSSKLVTQGWVRVRSRFSQLHSSSLIRKRRKTVFEIQTQTPPFLLDPNLISRRDRRESCSPPRYGASELIWKRRCERRFYRNYSRYRKRTLKLTLR